MAIVFLLLVTYVNSMIIISNRIQILKTVIITDNKSMNIISDKDCISSMFIISILNDHNECSQYNEYNKYD